MSTDSNDNKQDDISSNGTIVIDKEKEIGIVYLSPTKAVSVALIRTQAGYDYIAIRRLNRSSKRAEWKSINKLWIPFAGATEISGLINIAHNIGNRQEDWFKRNHKSLIRTIYKDKQTKLPPIVEPPEIPVVSEPLEREELKLIPVFEQPKLFT